MAGEVIATTGTTIIIARSCAEDRR